MKEYAMDSWEMRVDKKTFDDKQVKAKVPSQNERKAVISRSPSKGKKGAILPPT